MPTTSPPPLLQQLLVDTATLLAPRPDLHAALVEQLLVSDGPASTLVTGVLYAVALRPGMTDRLADRLDDVATAAEAVVRGHRVEDHDKPCTWTRLHGECDTCEAILQLHLDDAVRELAYLLGDQAVADLTAVTSVGAGSAA